MEQVMISSYNAEWKQDYEHEQKKIRYSFESLPVFLEHIGSTAVPGMDSKPTIDMMAGVEELSLMNETIIQRLAGIGYEYVHKPEFPERLFFRKGKWRAGTHHLHVYKYKGPHWINQLLFRDYLKSHEEVKQEYDRLKKKLQAAHTYDRVAYTEGKSDFIIQTIQQAREDKQLIARLHSKGLIL